MKEFIFNDCGVCTNPNKYGINWRNEIVTAQRPDCRWVYGINYQLDQPNEEGGGFGASLNGLDSYETERDAALAAIECLNARLSHRGYMGGDDCRKGIDECIAYTFEKFMQTTLF